MTHERTLKNVRPLVSPNDSEPSIAQNFQLIQNNLEKIIDELIIFA
jgi:hypothetical protein